MGSENSDIALHNLSGNQINNIEGAYLSANLYKADLRTKLTLNSPGRTYTKLRSFKFHFDMLYSLSCNRKEINEDAGKLAGQWLNSSLPVNGETPDKYIWAGILAFDIYVKELVKHSIISFKG